MSKSMKKPDFIAAIAIKAGVSRADASAVLAAQAEVATAAAIRGETVTLPGLARLSVKDRAARTGRNPATGQPMEVAAKRVIVAKPAGELSRAIAA